MITKAIVESIVDNYTVKVRIPRIDRLGFNSIRTSTEYLNEAIVCTLSNCDPNLQIGDIVFVALDDQNEDEVIILGHLYREKRTSTYCDLILNELVVNSNASLPIGTSIGEISYEELLMLKGANKTLQLEIDSLKTELEEIKSQLNSSSSN